MEHIVTKTLKNGYIKLWADEGYSLIYTPTNQPYSEAVVKEGEEKKFKAVERA